MPFNPDLFEEVFAEKARVLAEAKITYWAHYFRDCSLAHDSAPLTISFKIDPRTIRVLCGGGA